MKHILSHAIIIVRVLRPDNDYDANSLILLKFIGIFEGRCKIERLPAEINATMYKFQNQDFLVY